MKLTRLRLNGFKSFADLTELHIAPGLTGVVGPNGCGKSNLLEALRWVMGETRPTQMRGAGMEDVIFAGTQRRGARPWAEVALHFERDGREVDLVRRIARDGGSVYRLAGREARARDIQVMFADAASGAQSPALVRQGQISELIGQKPAARRRVIEEAAGVAGLQARRGEAAQRLTAAEANLSRVAEATGALADRLRTLERQVRNAGRYRELSAAIRRAEGVLLWRAVASAEEALAAAEGEARTRAGLVARVGAEAERAALSRVDREAALPPLRAAAAQAAEAVARARAEGEVEAAAARRAEARMAELEAALRDLARDLSREEALAQEAEETLARLAQEAQRLARASEGEAERIIEAAEASEDAAHTLAEAEAGQSGAAEAAARVAAEAEAALRRVEEARRVHDRAGAEAARAAALLAEAEGAAARAEAQGEGAAAAAREAEQALEEAEILLEEAEAAVAPAEAEAARARSAAAEAEARAAGLAAEVRALARLVAADGPRTGVGEGLHVPEGLEGAVAAALGRDLRAAAAEGEGSGWMALPPLEGGPALPGGAVPLGSLVEVPPELARRLAQVGLAGAGEAAALWPRLAVGQRLVTREGDLWRWDGLRLRAADAPEAAAEAEAMRRAARLPRLEEEANAAADLAAEARGTRDDAARALAEAQRRQDAARTARRAAEVKAAEARRLAGRAEADRALAEAKEQAAREARARAEAGLAAASAGLTEALSVQGKVPDTREARAAADAARAATAAARNALLAARGAEEDARRQAAGRARRAAEVAKEDALWRERREAAGHRAEDLAIRRERLTGELDGARGEPDRIAERATAVAFALRRAEAARAEAEAALAGAEAALREAQEAERAAERAASEAREARAAAEASRAAAAERAAAALLRLREERDQTPRELLDALGDDAHALPPDGQVQAELSELRRKREALGAVNLRAEEDAKALREEQEGLLREAEDLTAAVAELRKALTALNREGRERMLEAFARVNAEFGHLFARLFGGGEARLAWVDGDDPLDAGVEIMAQPPGKTLGTLSLLSGGEQTLTALALIFAVFRVTPAPVCVLDEVDAPLDDANVGRFCDLLDAMAQETETRFLVITHHAVTMARMDRLFGVTMAERGVSQLVSVDLRAAEALVA